MGDEGKKERRKCERFPFREEILIDGTSSCTTMDISESGLYICTIQSYQVNSEIDVTIPFKGEQLKVKAQVRYCQPGIGMGVMFVDLSAEQRAKIREIIPSMAKKTTQFDTEGNSVLVVEDNNTSRQAIKSALSKEGFFVMDAGDGIEAMKLLAVRIPSLIILDLYMKGMDGLKVLSFLRADPKWKELPVIVCSAHDTEDEKEKVMNAGANAFLSKKGTSPAKLVELAKAVLQQRSKT